MVKDLELLNEWRAIVKKKHEIWEEDAVGFGTFKFHWRNDSSALEYQKLVNRGVEIKRELFGDCTMHV